MLCRPQIWHHFMTFMKAWMKRKSAKRQIISFNSYGETSHLTLMLSGLISTIAGTIEAQHLHTIVMKTLLVFNQFEFRVRALLCDGASANLALLKELCAHKKGDDISACFVSPFDGNKIHLVICPSHQVSIVLLWSCSGAHGLLSCYMHVFL